MSHKSLHMLCAITINDPKSNKNSDLAYKSVPKLRYKHSIKSQHIKTYLEAFSLSSSKCSWLHEQHLGKFRFQPSISDKRTLFEIYKATKTSLKGVDLNPFTPWTRYSSLLCPPAVTRFLLSPWIYLPKLYHIQTIRPILGNRFILRW